MGSTTTINPVFLVAARRSGTTLLRLMLDGHPDLHWERGWELITDVIGASGEAPSAQQLRDLRIKLSLDAGSAFSAGEGEDGFDALRDAVQAYAQHHLGTGGKSHFGATVHTKADRLHYAYPDAKYIHLVRDPRDIAISVETLGWESTAWHAAAYWTRAEREWRVLEQRLAPESWIEIRYEDLVSDTQAVLTRACEFIGIPFSQHLFDYTQTSSYGMPDASLVERWRGKMSARDAALVEARTGEMMGAYGYERSQPPHSPSSIEGLLLDMRNSIANRTRRLKREGVLTFGLGVLHNRLNLTALQPVLERRQAADRVERISRLESKYSSVRPPAAAAADTRTRS